MKVTLVSLLLVVFTVLSLVQPVQARYFNENITLEGSLNFCTDTGSTDTYACSLDPAIVAYHTGTCYGFIAATVNTGAASINFNSKGAKTIKKGRGAARADLVTGDIHAGMAVFVCYDGTYMQMVNPSASAISNGDVQCTDLPALTGDVTSSAATCTTVLGNIPNDTTMAGDLLATVMTAPSTPASSKARVYIDSTSKNLAVKDDAGVIKHGIQSLSAVSGQCVTSVSDAGVASTGPCSGGLTIHSAVRVATTATLSSTYSNGTSGVGATLTASTLSVLSVDSVTPLTLNDRVLVKNQSSSLQNGIYYVSNIGIAGITAWVLTRSTDYDEAGDAEVVEGSFTIVEEGTTQAATAWVETGQGPFTIGSTAITWTQIGSATTPSGSSGYVQYNSGSSTFAGTSGLTVDSTSIVESLLKEKAAPSSPSSGYGEFFADSTAHNMTFKNPSGTVTYGAQATTSTTSQFFTAMSSAGVFSKAQPAFTDISGSVACTQQPALTGDVTTSAGACATTMTKGKTHGLVFTIGDPSGSALTVANATTDYLTVPFGCTISAYAIVIDAGTITVKFWKVATGTAIPTSSNSISTSGLAISTGTAIKSTTVSDFTSTTVTAYDIMAMNVTAVATAKYVQGVLTCGE